MRVDPELKRNGVFWIPENPEVEIPGTLRILDGGIIELESVGGFNGKKSVAFDPDSFETIIGRIELSDYVTLQNCRYISPKAPLDRMSLQKLRCQFALFGVGFSHTKNVKLDRSMLKVMIINGFYFYLHN